jgi:predicted homoserine dehydrogenase-like protein
MAVGGLPIGLAHGIALARDVAEGASLTWDDVSVDPTNAAYRFRREMERTLAGT